MTELSDDVANEISTFLAVGTATTAGERWLALCVDDTYTEATGAGYARIDMSTLMDVASGGVITNDTLVTFTTLDGGTYQNWAICNDETDPIDPSGWSSRGYLTVEVVVGAGGDAQIPIGNLQGSATATA